jgi:hypothetical protein
MVLIYPSLQVTLTIIQVRRQLEYQIYRDSHPGLFDGRKVVTTSAKPPRPAPPPFQPPTTLQAVRMIVSKMGPLGLWTGFRLHFVRDTLGTALYFAEYDVMRFWFGRKRGNDPIASSGKDDAFSGSTQGDLPDWAKGWLPPQLVPFLCGSLAGVTSWALIYPVDVSYLLVACDNN